MSFKKFILTLILLTAVSLYYVYLQTGILKLGYEIRKQEKILAQLLDQNKILVYNINVLSSPFNLDERLLSKKLDLSFVNKYRVIKVASRGNTGNLIPVKRFPFVNFLFDIFVPKAQAEASPVKVDSH